MRLARYGIEDLLWCALVRGPDPRSARDQESGWDTLLTWPARLALVLGGFLIGWIWNEAPVGIQLGWGLHYGLFAVISIVISFWSWILLLNLALAGAWLLLSWRSPEDLERSRVKNDLLRIVTWLNRQAGHIEAFAAWAAFVLVATHELKWQLPGLLAVLVLAEPLINGVARLRWFGGSAARARRARLRMARRSLIYGATVLGLLLLGLQAPAQWPSFLPLALTVLPALLVRSVRFKRRERQERESEAASAARLARAEHRLAPWSDVLLGPGLVLAAVGALAVLSLHERSSLAAEARADGEESSVPAPGSALGPRGPREPELALFVVADSQLHELAGAPFPGQLELIDAFVPVARRPVELDMLSAATLLRFADVYASLRAARPNLPFTHLGDFADLACANELARSTALLGWFAQPPGQPETNLAGVAPGNHDASFTGNFGWNPYWDKACKTAVSGLASARLDKAASDVLFGELLKRRLPPARSQTRVVSAWDPARPFSLTVSRARITVSELGSISGAVGAGAEPRGVLAVFLDTSDRAARNYGVAGELGTFSAAQAEQVLDAVAWFRGQGKAWADPWFVVFAHHPYDALTAASRKRFDQLIRTLDRPAGTRDWTPRVLALISAHTHKAEQHTHCVGQRSLSEFVVGSVIDPPQQAALIEIGLDDRQRSSLRLSTLPAVAGECASCQAAPTMNSGSCQRVMASLAAEPACEDLLHDSAEPNQPGKSCEALERPLTLPERVSWIARHGGSQDAREIRQRDERRARALLKCLCRERPNQPASCQRAEVLEHPLDHDGYAGIVEALAAAPLLARGSQTAQAQQEEVTCLSWAASAVQRHKAAGMTLADAVRCAFDDPTLTADNVFVAVAEETTCH